MVDLPAACQLSVKKYCTECRLQVVYSGRGGGGVCESRKSTISVMSGLFLHNCITLSSPNCTNILCHCRVGHRVLFRSERSVLFRSFKERNILFCSFFEFLASYETQKNDMFFSILFLRTEKNPKNTTFFCKERKRMQRKQRSFAKNARTFRSFAKERRTVRSFFQYIYI